MADKCNNLTAPFQAVFLKIKPYVNNVIFLDYFTQCVYLIGITGIAGVGVFLVIPYLYSSDGYRELCFPVQCIGAFMAFQLQMNWMCIKYTSSAYIPSIHGGKPEDIAIGQNITDAGNKNEKKTNQKNDNNPGKNGNGTKCIRRNNSSVMYVATEMPASANEAPKRKAYPYLSWTTCLFCKRPRPPRCHHCPVCNVCVMKRDHHCFFTGACVGVYNLRHFSVFMFWAMAATMFAAGHGIPFFCTDIWPRISVVDIIFPLAIIRSLLGYLEFKLTFFIILYWMLLFFIVMSVSFVGDCYEWIKSGRTSFEISFKMFVEDTRDFRGKLKAVFGNYWMLNFIVPLHFVFKPVEDPVLWPYIRG